MTSEIYYPEQRHMLAKTAIRRERLLPDEADGQVLVPVGARVALRDIVARGSTPAPYVLVEAAHYFDLSDPDKLFDLLEVRIGEQVSAGDVLAARSGRRGKRLISPIDGQVIDIAQGRIVLQALQPPLELEAGLSGAVVTVRKGRGVVVEMYGAVLQAVWGNNRRAIGTVRFEPTDGIETVYSDMIESQYQGAVMVTRRPLRWSSFEVINNQDFSAVIAPSMEPDVTELAMQAHAAIVLTEGFGSQRMSSAAAQFLDAMQGRQATVDAVLPALLETRRPEVIINVQIQPGERPPSPHLNLSLQIGREVRLVGAEHAGMVAHVVGLPKEPVLLENGLRVACAQVELSSGEKLHVPLANIEVSGS